MKAAELRKKSEKALLKQIEDLRKSITDFERDRFQNDERNVKLKKSLQKDLARALTVLNEKNNQDGEDK